MRALFPLCDRPRDVDCAVMEPKSHELRDAQFKIGGNAWSYNSGRSAVMSSALDALAVREGGQRCRNREFRVDEK